MINSENLTIQKNLYFNNNSILNIKQNSKITSMIFDYYDTLFFGFSDGSIIKYKFNEEPLNLKFDSQFKNISSNSEDEFDNIKCIFSTDRLIQNQEGNSMGVINMNFNEDLTDFISGNYKNYVNTNDILCTENVNEEKSFNTKSSGDTKSQNSFDSENLKTNINGKIENKIKINEKNDNIDLISRSNNYGLIENLDSEFINESKIHLKKEKSPLIKNIEERNLLFFLNINNLISIIIYLIKIEFFIL